MLPIKLIRKDLKMTNNLSSMPNGTTIYISTFVDLSKQKLTCFFSKNIKNGFRKKHQDANLKHIKQSLRKFLYEDYMMFF